MNNKLYSFFVVAILASLMLGYAAVPHAEAGPVKFKCVAFAPVHEETIKSWWRGMEMINKKFKGEVVFEEDSEGDELYLLHKGTVEVIIWTRTPEGEARQAVINTIWEGRSFGEMVLIGGGTRSATIRCVEDCLMLVIKRFDFDRLCVDNPRIGYQVMRNMAEDLVYKLRSSSLLLRGQVKWQEGELGVWR